MSRKDTIIIALLINAGLLALLFMLAVNTDDDRVSDQPEISRALTENHATTPSSSILTAMPLAANRIPEADDVDNFLKELSADEHAQPILIDDDGYVEMEKKSPAIVKTKPQPNIIADDANYVEVTVKRGDALEKIARSNGVTIETIKKVNNLTSNKLNIGQVLHIPVSKTTANSQASAASASAASASAASASAAAVSLPKPAAVIAESKPKQIETRAIPVAEPIYYTIKSGDNPWKLAKQYNVKFEDLLKLNGLNEERARNLKVGEKIRVR